MVGVGVVTLVTKAVGARLGSGLSRAPTSSGPLVQVNPDTALMNNGFCGLGRNFVCQTVVPFHKPPAYALVSGGLGTPLELTLTGERWVPADRVALVAQGVTLDLPPPDLPNGTFPFSIADLDTRAACGTGCVRVRYTAHPRNETPLALWYLADSDCVWRYAGDVALPPTNAAQVPCALREGRGPEGPRRMQGACRPQG